MSKQPKYEIVRAPLGLRLDLHAEWSEEIEEAVSGLEIVELCVRFWPKNNLGFLSRFTKIKGLQLAVADVDPSIVSALENLEWIDLYNFSGKSIDFTKMRRLERCGLYWNSTVSSVLELTQLKEFHVDKFPKSKLHFLSSFYQLEDLAILGCGATTLDDLRSIKTLRILRINQFPRLQRNSFLQDLPNLEELRVELTSGFSNLDALAELSKLQVLILASVGPIESLYPIAKLENLRVLGISGNKTFVADRDLSYVQNLAKLERLSVSGVGGVLWKAGSDSDGARLAQ
jgi:Leucine-rich repeat (LRR) protein